MTKKWWFLGLILLLVAFRLALPELIKHQANKTLATLPEYRGHVDGVHLAIWRGAFALNDVSIKHKNGDFALTLKEIWMNISWADLLKRSVVADVRIISPRCRILVPKPAKAGKEVVKKTRAAKTDIEAKAGKPLPDLLAELMPFRIRSFHLEDGTIRLQEEGSDIHRLAEKDKDSDEHSGEGSEKERALEARVTQLDIDVKNLTNAPHLSGDPNATGKVAALVMKDGKLNMDLKLNPTAGAPTFNIDFSLSKVNLVELNPLFRWQWGVDVNKGTFAMYMEAAAEKGRFKGYVKPFIHDLDVYDSKKDADKSLGAKIKEAVIGTVAAVLKNEEKENVAAKVPFEGKFDSPEVGIWQAILTVLRNAFVEALAPRLDKTL